MWTLVSHEFLLHVEKVKSDDYWENNSNVELPSPYVLGMQEIWRFRCGGSRRPFSLLYSSSEGSTRRTLIVAFVTGSRLEIRRRPVVSPMNSQSLMLVRRKNAPQHSRDLSVTKNMPSAAISTCDSLIGSFHGREIWSASWLSDTTLCTAGEDNTIRLTKLVGPSPCPFGLVGLPTTGLLFPTLAQFYTYGGHPAAVRCLATVDLNLSMDDQCSTDIKTEEDESSSPKVKIVASGGARQTVNVYWAGSKEQTTKSGEKTALNATETEELRLHHLYCHPLELDRDERIMSLAVAVVQVPHFACSIGKKYFSLHLFIGTSSGRVLHLSTLLHVHFMNPHFSPLPGSYKTDSRLTVQLVSLNDLIPEFQYSGLEKNLKQMLKEIDVSGGQFLLELQQIDHLRTSIQSSSLVHLPNRQRDSIRQEYSELLLLSLGCTVGNIHLYVIALTFKSGLLSSFSMEKMSLPRLSLIDSTSYRAHQVGTNSVRLVIIERTINKNPYPNSSQSTTIVTLPVIATPASLPIHKSARPCLPILFDSLPRTFQLPLHPLLSSSAIEIDFHSRLLIVSSGDDNSIAIQAAWWGGSIDSSQLKLLGLVRLPRAHASSVRGNS